MKTRADSDNVEALVSDGTDPVVLKAQAVLKEAGTHYDIARVSIGQAGEIVEVESWTKTGFMNSETYRAIEEIIGGEYSIKDFLDFSIRQQTLFITDHLDTEGRSTSLGFEYLPRDGGLPSPSSRESWADRVVGEVMDSPEAEGEWDVAEVIADIETGEIDQVRTYSMSNLTPKHREWLTAYRDSRMAFNPRRERMFILIGYRLVGGIQEPETIGFVPVER